MSVAKIAISIDSALLEKLDQLVAEGKFKSRSSVIQSAVEEKVISLSDYQLARECEKLNLTEEQSMADEWFQGEETWHEF